MEEMSDEASGNNAAGTYEVIKKYDTVPETGHKKEYYVVYFYTSLEEGPSFYFRYEIWSGTIYKLSLDIET
jgi:hypothetical protein